jgi:hypothetical protein
VGSVFNKKKPQKDVLTEETLNDIGSWLEASPKKVITSLGSTVWNIKKYTPHCSKIVKVTTLQIDSCA